MSEHPPPPSGQGPYGSVPYQSSQDHPQAIMVLVLGLIGLVACQILGPVAWVMGNSVVREIDASGGTVRGRDAANIGRICGIIATALMILALLLFLGVLAVWATIGFGILASAS
ncbi:MAG: DUF4190 domain-containing protein [Actinomycetota bacterium]|nr:DUF4190 domain-containing protein [Actinomycetota bacterium]